MINGTWSGTHPECISNIQFYRLEPPENAKIIYANERGIINNNFEKYSMRTFAEIQCENDLVVDGENFLSCTETTQWDYPLPVCVVKVSTETPLNENWSTSTNRNISEKDESSIEDNADLTTDLLRPPTLAFWRSLKKFLYHRCESPKNTSSELCSKTSRQVEFSELSSFQPPETDEPMDRLLLDQLQQCVNSMKEYSQKLTFENTFECISNWENPSAMSSEIKDSLRLITCFYIDTVSSLTDQTKGTVNVDESITDKIKGHLTRIVTVVFQNYLKDAANDHLNEKADRETENFTHRTTEMISENESQCDLMLIPTLPNNTLVKNVTNSKVKILFDVDNIRMVPLFVPEMSKVHFEFVKGYQLIGTDYTECLFGEWTDIALDCEQIFCEAPLRPMNMDLDHVNDTQFSIGYKIQLKCREGYMLYGSSLIFCTSDGQWTKVMARCSKISCNKPYIPSGATILNGYQDKIPNTKMTVEIYSLFL